MSEESTTPDLVELVLAAMPALERRDLDGAISFWGRAKPDESLDGRRLARILRQGV
jgi:hypothetical protein